jgi:hypothetical protein
MSVRIKERIYSQYAFDGHEDNKYLEREIFH